MCRAGVAGVKIKVLKSFDNMVILVLSWSSDTLMIAVDKDISPAAATDRSVAISVFTDNVIVVVVDAELDWRQSTSVEFVVVDVDRVELVMIGVWLCSVTPTAESEIVSGCRLSATVAETDNVPCADAGVVLLRFDIVAEPTTMRSRSRALASSSSYGLVKFSSSPNIEST